MKLATAHFPTRAISPTVSILSLLLAVGIIIMVSAQLMSYEKFVPIMQSYVIPGNVSNGQLLASLLVVGEVLSLPFLLRMSLSPLFRIFSAVACVVTPLLWCVVVSLAYYHQTPTMATGFFGGFIKASPGLWAIVYAFCWLLASIGLVWLLRDDLRLSRRV